MCPVLGFVSSTASKIEKPCLHTLEKRKKEKKGRSKERKLIREKKSKLSICGDIFCTRRIKIQTS